MVSNQSKKLQIICSLVILFTVALMSLGGASHSPVQSDELLRARAVPTSPEEEYVPDQVIVKFKTGICSATRVDLYKRLGASVFYTSPCAGFEVVQIPQGKTVAEIVEAYSKQSIVEYAEPNYIRRANWSPNDSLYSLQWHFDQINLEAAWDLDTTAPNYGGDPSIVVAVLDSGVAYETYDVYQKAPDLANTNFVQGWDFVNNDAHPNDDSNHGTHVCGTIAQSTNNGLGVAGIAFNTAIMPVKVLDDEGSGTIQQLADGIYYAANNGAKIINISLCGSGTSDTERDALAYAYNHGVTIICAAGNEYEHGNPPQYPAAYDDYCIAVGAIRYDQTHAYYSNTGSYVDVVAPGGDMRVDQNVDGQPDGVLQQTFAEGDPTDFSYYYFLQGTSMASPHVAGVAALILAKNPSFTPDQVRQALESTATDLGVAGRDDVYGWGLLNAPAAVSSTPGQPDITVTPPSFDETLAPDTTQDYTLTIGNDGGATLTYGISDSDTTVGLSVAGGESLSLIEPASMMLEVPLESKPVEPENSGEAQAGWQNIMTDGFEGAFPGVWDLWVAPGATDAYWGKDGYRYATGSYSAFCAKSGSVGVNPPTDYPNNMEAWMIYGPFSLADATDAELNFYCWLDTEYDYDYLYWMASIDGSYFYGSGWDGNSGGWVSQSFDLTNVYTLGNLCGQPQVWIAFIFESDAMGTYTGAFVDDVVLRKYVGAANSPPNTPSSPSPANHATGVSINADLSWTGGDPDGDTVTYDVYFGTSSTPPLVSNDQSGTTYDPGTLAYSTKYYWKIVATDNHAASTTGLVWDFTTALGDCPWLDENPKSGSVPAGGSNDITVTINTAGLTVGNTYTAEIVIANNDPDENPKVVPVTLHVAPGANNPPNMLSSPSPANHATGVSINADLSWTGGDPDAWDTVTYDVYFGTSLTPPLVSNDQSGTTYEPGTLAYNTKYYWKIIATDNHGASTTGPLWDFTTGPASNNPPQLSNPSVQPPSGTPATGFYYYANYFDSDGDSPSTNQVYVDGTPYTMSLYSGSASNGVYRYGSKNLSVGWGHNYYFYFEDGNGGIARLPSSGAYSGPTISDGEWDPWDYDENSDSIIQKGEVIKALQDYFDLKITKAQVIELLQLYFS